MPIEEVRQLVSKCPGIGMGIGGAIVAMLVLCCRERLEREAA